MAIIKHSDTCTSFSLISFFKRCSQCSCRAFVLVFKDVVLMGLVYYQYRSKAKSNISSKTVLSQTYRVERRKLTCADMRIIIYCFFLYCLIMFSLYSQVRYLTNLYYRTAQNFRIISFPQVIEMVTKPNCQKILVQKLRGKHKANQYHDGDFIPDKTYWRQKEY